MATNNKDFRVKNGLVVEQDTNIGGNLVVTGTITGDGSALSGVTNYTSTDFAADLATKTTTNLAEGTNLYYTNARFDTQLATKSTTNLAEGTNLYYTTARANTDFDSRLSLKSTSDLTEGTNLYYTDARVGTYLSTNSYATQTYVNTAVSNLVDSAPAALDTLNELAAALGDDANFSATVTTALGNKFNTSDFNSTFDTRLGTKSTTNLAEGTNLYYTDERVDDRVSSLLVAGTNVSLSYNDTANTLTVSASDTATNVSGGTANVTTLTTSSTVTHNGGTANGVAYLNGSKVLTTGSALTFDGTNLSSTGGATFQGGPTGYGGGEVRLGTSASGQASAISTTAIDSPILFFDHRGTSNTGVFAWRNGTAASNELARLTSTGLGIGTSSPAVRLSVNGSTDLGASSEGTTFSTRISGYGILQTSTGTRFGQYSNLILHANTSWTATARRFLITNGLNANTFAIIRSTDANTDPAINGNAGALTSGTVDLAINNAGNVGIGTQTPTDRFTVTGGDARVNGPNNVFLKLSGAAINEKHVDFYHDDTLAFENFLDGSNNFIWRSRVGGLLERMRIKSDGNVGIGTTDPGTRLDVLGNVGDVATFRQANVVLKVGTTNFGNGEVYYDAYPTSNPALKSAYIWRQGSTPSMILDNTGRLLVGTTSNFGGAGQFAINQLGGSVPSIHLIGTNDVGGGGREVSLILSGVTNDTGPAYGNLAKIAAGKENATQGNTAGYLNLYTTPNGGVPTERVRITSGGNVGIGVSNPESLFHISGANPQTRLQYTGTAGNFETLTNFVDFRGAVNAAIGNNLQDDGVGTAAAHLVFKTATGGLLQERVRITREGNVGIGTTAVSSEGRLTVGTTGVTDKNGIILNRGALGSLPGGTAGIFNEWNGIGGSDECLTFRAPAGYKFQNNTGTNEWMTITNSAITMARSVTLSQGMSDSYTAVFGGTYVANTWYDVASSSNLTNNGIYIIFAYLDTYFAGGGHYDWHASSVPFGWNTTNTNSSNAFIFPTFMGSGHADNGFTFQMRLRQTLGGTDGRSFIDILFDSTLSSLNNTTGRNVTIRFKRIA
jgi:hypothetical protein